MQTTARCAAIERAEFSSTGTYSPFLKASLGAARIALQGYFANAVQMVPSGGYNSLRAGATMLLHVHPSSVLFNTRPPHLVYHNIQKTDKTWMLEVCTVDPDWLTELAPHFFERRR
jgi:ATP-dependent RNA helicase DDX35